MIVQLRKTLRSKSHARPSSAKRFLIAYALSLFILPSLFGQSKNEAAYTEIIQQRPYPQWFKDAKLGIFIHWGLYSVPAYGGKESYSEWFLRGLQVQDPLRTNFMKKTYGSHFTYKDFAPLFKAELFQPDEWAQLFKNAGARYVVLVSKHHDGFALWPSKYNRNWNSMDVGAKRDLVGELSKSVRKHDLKMGLYYSLSEWNHPLHRWYTDPHDSIAPYVENYMIPQFRELVGTYKPSVIFADGEWFNSAQDWHSAELISWYYDLVGDEAIVNNRWGHGLDHGFLTPEYSAGLLDTHRPWAEVRGLGRSFGLNRNENLEAYGTSKDLIQRFVQTVAHGGGMILNVGPKADGQIPLIQQERLLQLGSWLQTNGEAIYGSRPYTKKIMERTVQMERIDSLINFNWVRNSPLKGIREDDFQVTWSGYIQVPKTGTYSFEILADDEATLSIDQTPILIQDKTKKGSESEVMGANTAKGAVGKIRLKENSLYPLQITYKEKKQYASIELFWKRDKEERRLVPASAFFTDPGKTQAGLKGTYTSLKTYLCFTQNQGHLYAISFEWPQDRLALKVPSPGEGAKISLLGLDKSLPWTYSNGTLLIDTRGITYAEMPSHDAWTFKIKGGALRD